MAGVEGEKLSKFEHAVFADIEAEAAQILEKAREEHTRQLSETEARLVEEAFRKIQERVRRVDAEKVRLFAQDELSGKKQVLRRREELTESLFQTVEDEVHRFVESREYADFLQRWLKEELSRPEFVCSGEVCVQLRSDDMRYAELLRQCTEVPVTVREDRAICFGGLSILLQEQGVLIDRTIDALLEEERSRFRREGRFSLDGSVGEKE